MSRWMDRHVANNNQKIINDIRVQISPVLLKIYLSLGVFTMVILGMTSIITIVHLCVPLHETFCPIVCIGPSLIFTSLTEAFVRVIHIYTFWFIRRYYSV